MSNAKRLRNETSNFLAGLILQPDKSDLILMFRHDLHATLKGDNAYPAAFK